MIDKIDFYLGKSYRGIFIYFILGIVIFFNPYGTSFADDSLEILLDYDRYRWNGFVNSYGMNSVYYLHDATSHFLYYFFGKNNHLWFYFILFLHTTTSYFIYKFFKLVFERSLKIYSKEMALFISLLFMNSAYNTENLFWIATFHYNFCFLFFFYVAYYIANQQGILSTKSYLMILSVFGGLLTMHEITFFFPFGFYAIIHYFDNENKSTFQNTIKKACLFLIPFGLLECIVLGITKVLKGTFIPHYGMEHVKNYSLYNFLYTFYQHFIKIFGFVHFLNFKFREKLYEVNEKTMLVFFILLIFVLILFIKYKKVDFSQHREWLLIGFGIFLFYIPVSNMYFYWHFPVLNDRLEYFLLPFCYALFVMVMYGFFKSYAKYFVLLFLLINIFLFRIQINKIQESIHFTEHIVSKSYEKYLDKDPVILNLPYIYNGFYSFRKPHRFKNFMKFQYNKDIKFHYVSSMAFNSIQDSIEYKFINDSTIHMKNRGTDSWFLYESNGGIDYENEDLKVDFTENNQEAFVSLKFPIKNKTILYCQGKNGFVEIKK